MAIEIDIKGLSGVVFENVTVDETTDTLSDLITATEALEDTPGNLIDATYYDKIVLSRDPSINSIDSTGTLSSLGVVDGDIFHCVLKDDAYRSGYAGIPDNLTGLTKEQRQVRKLNLASIKRAGLAAGLQVPPQVYYRPNNTYDLTSLPDLFNNNDGGTTVDESYVQVDDNPNADGLLPKRPWVAVGTIAAPESIAESVDGGTLPDLQVWYDGADTSTYKPSATDEGQITQWTDKSNFAHNANPEGGAAKPTYENTDTSATNGNGYLEFDGNDVLSINPFTAVTSTDAFTIFIVGALGSTTGTQYFGSTNEGGLSIFSNGTNFAANVSGGTATGTTAIDTDWHIHTLVYDGANTSLTYRLDKNNEATATPGGTTQGTANAYYIGGRDATTSLLSAGSYVGEVIMFSRVLGATEYANVENYLSNKWGL